MSPPEALLWQRWRSKPNGLKFRRQHPIEPYAVDFFCRAAGLVIEVDGAFHDKGPAQDHDGRRQTILEAQGYQVVRVSGADVMRDAGAVASSILALAESPHHRPADGPPPRSEED